MEDNRKHLKDELIPKLKHIAATVETRDLWATLIEKNRVRYERAMNDAAGMQALLRSQLQEVKRGEEMTKQCTPELLEQQKSYFNAKVSSELLDALLKL